MLVGGRRHTERTGYLVQVNDKEGNSQNVPLLSGVIPMQDRPLLLAPIRTSLELAIALPFQNVN